MLSSRSTDKENICIAYMGLAALGEPVLEEVRAALESGEFTDYCDNMRLTAALAMHCFGFSVKIIGKRGVPFNLGHIIFKVHHKLHRIVVVQSTSVIVTASVCRSARSSLKMPISRCGRVPLRQWQGISDVSVSRAVQRKLAYEAATRASCVYSQLSFPSATTAAEIFSESPPCIETVGVNFTKYS